MSCPRPPTKRVYDDFDAAYGYFNKRLFEGRLPPCLITVRPHRGAYGYFSAKAEHGAKEPDIPTPNGSERRWQPIT